MAKVYDPAAEGRAAVREDDKKRAENKMMGLIKAIKALSIEYTAEYEEQVTDAIQNYMEKVNPEFDFVALASLVTDGNKYEADTVEFVSEHFFIV